MSTTLEIPRGESLLAEEERTYQEPIVVATDGTEYSKPALEAALELARQKKAKVKVIAVFEPMPMAAFEFGVMLTPPDTIAEVRAAFVNRVRAQVDAVAGDESGWEIDVRDGDPAAEIAGVARDARARVLILGVRHREVLDRIFGRETSLRTLRLSRSPVLVVPSRFDNLPRRVLIATDFSPGSMIAARTALRLFDTISMVYLVHVAPRPEQQPEAFAAWVAAFGEQVGPAFARLKAELGVPPSVLVETVTLEGKPSREILRFARSTAIDLIVTGSRGAGWIDRMLVGSTARGLLRGAHCAVLAVRPPAALDTPYALLEPGREHIPRELWASELQAFSRRNLGRRASIEVDDPEIGAQSQEHDYPLLGVAYDHHDQRVDIMVGDMGRTGRHLTRGIENVDTIDILRDARDRDWILRVAHGDGQTILTLRS